MMKKLFLILLLLLPVCAFVQTVEYDTSPTLQWDYPDVDENGDPWLPEDIISFEVYLWNTADGDITLQAIESLNYFGTTTDKEITLSFTNRYNWAVAVLARVTDGDGNTEVSGVAYSTVSEDTNDSPFVYAPSWSAIQLPKPTGLRDSGI